ncbi:uncharacterized protein LOC106716698 [Papilio machaon]|uniref:uncharacterized protein LOC106716698 n=1 Tax=Papilio machaon TaxID=76193 RepID=UPI001E663E65|nr:uncharacterized protein LOC106716698 [Papilio machaon]
MPKLCSFGCAFSGVPMHRFPHADKFAERFRAWVNLVGGKLETPVDYDYYSKKLVCDIHFTARDRNRNKRLNALAVPSLHLHGTSDSSILGPSLVDVGNQPSTSHHFNTGTPGSSTLGPSTVDVGSQHFYKSQRIQ